MNVKDTLIKIRRKIAEIVKNGNLISVEAKITMEDIDDDTKEKLLGTPLFTENTEIPAAKEMSDFIQSKYSCSNNLGDKGDELIESQNTHTSEEGPLHQKLADYKVKRLRLKRELEQSKMNKS